MEEEYVVGDVVLLRSGGPLMTVTHDADVVNSSVQCTWFSTDGLVQVSRFIVSAIHKMTDAELAVLMKSR